MSRPKPVATGLSGRTAILIDLENVLYGPVGLLDEATAAGILESALTLAGPADHVLAIAPASVVRRYVATLARLKVPFRLVVPGPDAADIALLELADHLASTGYSRFVVLSADHAFSDLCRMCPTTVIVRVGQPVARELRDTASAILAA